VVWSVGVEDAGAEQVEASSAGHLPLDCLILLAVPFDASGAVLQGQAGARGVADPASRQAAHNVVNSRFGRLGILVNNAGVVHVTDIADETLDTWNLPLSINLTGALLGLQTMLPLLRKGTRSAVVDTSSIFGPSGAPGYAAYAASKAGLSA